MPSACGYAWSEPLDQLIKQKAQQYNMELMGAYATIAVESAFNPRACGDHVNPSLIQRIHIGSDNARGAVIAAPPPANFYVAWECIDNPGVFGCSHGLLQLNTCGGQGSAMERWQLIDPAQNLDRGLPPMSQAVTTCEPGTSTFPDFVCCFAGYSGHPGFIPCTDQRVINLLNAWNCMAQAFQAQDPFAFLRMLGCLTSLPLALLLTPFAAAFGKRRSPAPARPTRVYTVGADLPRKKG